MTNGTCPGPQLVFRFEPFILAAECKDMDTAQFLVACGRSAGFRESGVTATNAKAGSSGRIIAGLRCSLRIEVPGSCPAPVDLYHCACLRSHLTSTSWQMLGGSSFNLAASSTGRPSAFPDLGLMRLKSRRPPLLQAPISNDGRLLVTNDYISFLVARANDKMTINHSRIQRFHELLQKHFCNNFARPLLQPTEKVHSQHFFEQVISQFALFILANARSQVSRGMTQGMHRGPQLFSFPAYIIACLMCF